MADLDERGLSEELRAVVRTKDVSERFGAPEALLGLVCVAARARDGTRASRAQALRQILDELIDSLESDDRKIEARIQFFDSTPNLGERQRIAGARTHRHRDTIRRDLPATLVQLVDGLLALENAAGTVTLEPVFSEPAASTPSSELWLEDDLFDGCSEGRARLTTQLQSPSGTEDRTWWQRADSGWYGPVFAFWNKTTTLACEEVSFEAADRTVYDSKYWSAAHDQDRAEDGGRKGATLVGMTPFLDDYRLFYRETNYGVNRWAERNAEDLLEGRVGGHGKTTVFGIKALHPYPTLMCVNALLATSDRWIVLSLRSGFVATYPFTWEATFGELIDPETDKTVFDTVARGLREEFGESVQLHSTTCLAIGQQYGRDAGRLVLSTPVLAAARLTSTLEEVWSSLSRARRVLSRTEHVAWMACRLATRSRVLRLLQETRESRRSGIGPTVFREIFGPDPGVEVALYPYNDHPVERAAFGWTPPSPATLFLASEWFEDSRVTPA